MPKLVRFFQAITRVDEAQPFCDGAKTPDRRQITWGFLSLGRWQLMLATEYVGSKYGDLRSDSTEIKLVVTRNEK